MHRQLPAHAVRHHATSDVIFSDEETEFLNAMRNYQASTGKKFPTFSETLYVVKSLGYKKAEVCHVGVGHDACVESDEPLSQDAA